MSIDNTTQAHGRATFTRAGTLMANGFDCVTYLGSEADYKSIRAYPHFLEEITEKMLMGRSLKELLVDRMHKSDKRSYP